jgi:hypothetical protein
MKGLEKGTLLKSKGRSTYLDIEELLSEHRRSLVDGETGTIEGSTKHLNTHWHAHDITGELDGRADIVNIGGTLENLQS